MEKSEKEKNGHLKDHIIKQEAPVKRNPTLECDIVGASIHEEKSKKFTQLFKA